MLKNRKRDHDPRLIKVGRRKLVSGSLCPKCKKGRLYEDLAGQGIKSLACACGYRDYGREYPAITGEKWAEVLEKEKKKIKEKIISMGLYNTSALPAAPAPSVPSLHSVRCETARIKRKLKKSGKKLAA